MAIRWVTDYWTLPEIEARIVSLCERGNADGGKNQGKNTDFQIRDQFEDNSEGMIVKEVESVDDDIA